MTSAYKRLSRVSSAIAIAFALSAAPASAAGYLKLGDIKGEAADTGHGGQIEIESWSWGAAQAGSMGSHAGGGGGGAGKVDRGTGEPAVGKASKIEALTVKQGAAEAKKKGNVEYSWKVEEGVKGSPAPGEAEITLKGAAKPGKPPSNVTLKRGVTEDQKAGGFSGGVRVATGDVDGDGRADTVGKELDMTSPLLAGGRLTAVVPEGTCRAGARYPTAELGTGKRVYMLHNVTVASCAPASGGDRPTESISLNYTKVTW